MHSKTQGMVILLLIHSVLAEPFLCRDKIITDIDSIFLEASVKNNTLEQLVEEARCIYSKEHF